MTVISLPPPSPSLIVFGRDHAGKPHASWFDGASAELATKAAGLMNMRAVPVADGALREIAGTLPRGRVFASGKAFTPFVKPKLYDRLVELTRELFGLASEAANENTATEDAKTEKTGDTDTVAEGTTAPGPEAEGTTIAVPAGPVAGQSGEPTAATAGTPGKSGKGKPPGKKAVAAPERGHPRPTAIAQVGLGSLVLASLGRAEGWFEAEVIGINGGMLTLKWRDYNEPTVMRRPADLAFLPPLAG